MTYSAGMGTGEDASDRAKDAARMMQGSSTLRRVARIGFVVLGVLHTLIGAAAVSIGVFCVARARYERM